MKIRIDVKTGYQGHLIPTEGFKVVQDEGETLDDLIDRVIGQLYTSLEQFEGAVLNEDTE